MKIIFLQLKCIVFPILSLLCLSASEKCLEVILDYNSDSEKAVMIITSIAGLGCLWMGCVFLSFSIRSVSLLRKEKSQRM
jgi:hypothetical protein